MTTEPAKKRGRPRLGPAEGKRSAIGFRATLDTRKKLEEAARRTGRSLSQEVEFRLEQSLQIDQTYGGERLSLLFRMLAVAAQIVETRTGASIVDDEPTRRAVRASWKRLLDQELHVAEEWNMANLVSKAQSQFHGPDGLVAWIETATAQVGQFRSGAGTLDDVDEALSAVGSLAAGMMHSFEEIEEVGADDKSSAGEALQLFPPVLAKAKKGKG